MEEHNSPVSDASQMRPSSTRKTALRWLLALFLVVAGVNHFVRPAFYLRMMPPYVPWHAEAVFVSGVCEVVIGLALLVPRLVVPAAWGAIALFVAIFPANVHMALHPEQFPEVPAVLLWIRLPFQAMFILWAYWFTREPHAEQTHEG